MNRVVFALLEILAAAVFLVPIFGLWLRDIRKCAVCCIVSFYLVAVWSLVGLPTVLYCRFDINLNLIPFAGMVADWKNCLLNILLFVPLGFLLPVLWKDFQIGKNTLLVGFWMSLAIELLQILTLRATDVNDLITNTFGSWLGFLLARWGIGHIPALARMSATEKSREFYTVCAIVTAVMFFPQPFLSATLWELFVY